MSKSLIVEILAPIVAEITACGYCDGSCGSCQDDAGQLADALLERDTDEQEEGTGRTPRS